MEIISNSVEKTQSLAGQLVKEIISKRSAKQTGEKRAFVIALTGELGAGKTTFIQGLGQELGVKEKVLSPTFLIMRRFDLPAQSLTMQKLPYRALYHLDFYRLNDHKEIMDLGFEEILKNKNNIIVAEWADKFKKILPKNTVWVKLEWLGDEKRRVSVM